MERIEQTPSGAGTLPKLEGGTIGAFRERIRRLLRTELPPDWKGVGALERTKAQAFTESWREVMRQNDLLALTWPVEHGGAGLTRNEQIVLAEEFARAGVPNGAYSDSFS